jgi:hypothetical protein
MTALRAGDVLRAGEQDYTYGTGLLIFRMIFTPGGDR